MILIWKMLRKKYKKKSELVQNILDPDLSIDEKFVTWMASTDSGMIHIGLLVQENKKQITLKTAEGKTISLRKDELENLKKSKQSVMPKNILADLTAQEAADLIEWFSGSRE